jgi:hypothetical protein
MSAFDTQHTYNNYLNGYIERRSGGRYEGVLTIEGIDLSPIYGVYFKEDGKSYLWIRRKPLLEYDNKSETYKERQRQPRWEIYLQKQVDENTVAYKGVCTFFRFRYSVVGIWDRVLGKDKQRLNLFVERLPMNQQTIINGINERNRKKH